jgi:transcriptional regulator with XRE-family HTH domain
MQITMQAFSSLQITDDYNPGMPTGRPAKHPRSPFGERVFAAREAAGLSQAEVASQLGLSQNAYAMWERRPVALRPEQIEQLATALGVSIDVLFGKVALPTKPPGPMGRAKKTFEALAALSRSEQARVLDLVEPLVRVFEKERAKKMASATH